MASQFSVQGGRATCGKANFYRATRTKKPRCDFETVGRASVLVLEDGEGGGACAWEPAPRRERLVHGPVSPRPVQSRGPARARAPPAQAPLEANESAAAGCAATTFPVFFLNSSGGGRSAAPSPRLSGNTPPHTPRCACPLLSSLITKRFRSATACPGPLPSFPAASAPAAPPPRRGFAPAQPGAARFEAEPGRRGLHRV